MVNKKEGDKEKVSVVVPDSCHDCEHKKCPINYYYDSHLTGADCPRKKTKKVA